jgi:hypothetical protein
MKTFRSLIVAISSNQSQTDFSKSFAIRDPRVINQKGSLPLDSDLRFHSLSTGNIVLFNHKTRQILKRVRPAQTVTSVVAA